MRRWIVLALALTVGAAGCGSDEAPPPVREKPAVYVDADSVGGRCSDDRPAKAARRPATPWCSLERAREEVPDGHVIDVRAGSYPKLFLEGEEDQHWRAHRGERAVLDGLEVLDSSGIVVEGFASPATADVKQSTDVTLRGLQLTGAFIRVRQGEDVLLERNRVRDVPADVEPNAYGIVVDVYGSEPSRAVTIRGNAIEGTCDDPIKLVSVDGAAVTGNRIAHAQPCGRGEHTDAIHTISGRDVTIRGNRIDDAAHGLQFTDRAPQDGDDPDPHGAIVEGNVLNAVLGYPLHGGVGERARIVGNVLMSSGEPPLGIDLSTDSGNPDVVLDGYTVVGNRTNGAISIPAELLAGGGVAERNEAGR
jgi:hypothetical protein